MTLQQYAYHWPTVVYWTSGVIFCVCLLVFALGFYDEFRSEEEKDETL